jgi:2-dehydropantoate 2-reductase
MVIHIIGAGAIGKLLAARLSRVRGGENLVLVAHRRAQADAVGGGGLVLRDGEGTSVTFVRTVAWPDYAAGGNAAPADAVMLAVKQQHFHEEMLRAACSHLKPDGIVVAWMNGIGHERLLAGMPGKSRSALAITTEGATSRGDAEVEHTGAGTTKLGLLSGGSAEARRQLKNVACWLAAAGFDVGLSNDIMKEAWNKLVINAVINPLTAIHGIPNGDLLASPFLLQTMRTLYTEAKSVAAKAGVQIDDALWNRLLDVCRRTARNRSSMLQDLAAGRKSEIEWINGSLIRAAQRHGVAVPGHQAVFDAVRGIENART